MSKSAAQKDRRKKQKKAPPFVHLHVHTENSLLDGKGRIADTRGMTGYVSHAKASGMSRLAIMDHGVLCGAPEFYRECRSQDIEPIIAEEFYFTPKFKDYTGLKSADASKLRYHVGIMARDAEGFKVLCELSTATHGQYHFKPMLDRKLIESMSKKDRKKLVVLSGCAGSIISQHIIHGRMKEAEEEMRWWAKMFPHFYVELMHHKTAFDKKLNAGLVRLAKKLGLKWVITNDPHYVLEDEACHHDVILAISTGSDIDDPERFRFEGEGYWLKTPAEMVKTWKRYDNGLVLPGLANTNEVADLCRIRIPEWEARTWHIPKFPKVDDSTAELRRLAEKGLKKVRLLGVESGEHKIEEYRKQMEHELAKFAEIPKMADFLLVTEDVIRWARKKMGMRVGPGRGSICGSVVAFLIGIHKVDPIYYDLLFERFLNPDRPKMPDVDTDYPKSRRQEVLDYYPATYGAENTMPVAAFGTMQEKATFKNIAGTHGMDWKEKNKWAKKIIEDEEGNVVWPKEITDRYPDMIEQINALLGLKTNLSSHPAGMVIFDPEDSVRDYCPEMWIPPRNQKPGRWVMQYNLASVDEIGLLKQDNLALRTLDTIDECVRLVKLRKGITIEPDDWWPGHEKDDAKVFRMLTAGETAGVFQMEGGANTQGIQELKCREFEDIVLCTSTYRAGPMMAGTPGRLKKNRKDQKIRVIHKSLKKILKKSWGEMIYDEQMLQMLHDAAGLSWSRVDDVKNAMKKKKIELMEEVREDAIKGFQKTSGMTEEEATQVWRMIAAQASYLFNRSHAVAYSITSYQTARLKYLYPLEYFAALLRTVEGKSDAEKAKRERYMKEAVRMGFKIEPPDVNISDDGFMPAGHDRLLFGLGDVAKFGPAAAAKFNEFVASKTTKKGKRPKKLFESEDEVYAVIKNRGVTDNLRACGAYRSLGVKADVKKQEEILKWQFEDRMVDHRKKYGDKYVAPKKGKSQVRLYGEIVKVIEDTTKTGKPYVKWIIQWAPGEEYRITLWSDVDEFWHLQTGSIVMVKGSWNPTYKNVSVGNADQLKVIKAVTLQAA